MFRFSLLINASWDFHSFSYTYCFCRQERVSHPDVVFSALAPIVALEDAMLIAFKHESVIHVHRLQGTEFISYRYVGTGQWPTEQENRQRAERVKLKPTTQQRVDFLRLHQE